MRAERTRARERSAGFLALLALAALALLPPRGVTVCLGHDGHVALAVGSATESSESGEEPHCPCDVRSSGETTALAPESAPPAHEPCDDLPLAGTVATALPRQGDDSGSDSRSATGSGDLLPTLATSILDPASDVAAGTPRTQPALSPTGRHAIAIAPALSSRRIV